MCFTPVSILLPKCNNENKNYLSFKTHKLIQDTEQVNGPSGSASQHVLCYRIKWPVKNSTKHSKQQILVCNPKPSITDVINVEEDDTKY